jgi:N-acetylmuramoyl-L-alanine amidase
MKFTRRELLIAGLGLLVTGCTQTPGTVSRRPGTPWPGGVSAPTRSGPGTRTVHAPAPRVIAKATSASPPGSLLRSWWTRTGPIRSKVNPMKGISRITVHHEGHTPVWFTDERSTKARLVQVRNIHTRDRHWGDIGYHYVIDRAGRVIEGRPLAYQGAHVKNQNPHNIGVMLLGNFEKQSPSQAQLTSLQSSLRYLMARYRVPVRRVYTHRELGPTVCPGRNLQPRVAGLRTSGALA